MPTIIPNNISMIKQYIRGILVKVLNDNINKFMPNANIPYKIIALKIIFKLLL